MDYNQNTGVVRGDAAGKYGNAYTGQSVSGAHGFAYNTNTANHAAHYHNNTYADRNGNDYKHNPSTGWQQHTNSGERRRPPALTSRRRTTGLRPATPARGAGAFSIPADGLVDLVLEVGLIVRDAALAASDAVSAARLSTARPDRVHGRRTLRWCGAMFLLATVSSHSSGERIPGRCDAGAGRRGGEPARRVCT